MSNFFKILLLVILSLSISSCSFTPQDKCEGDKNTETNGGTANGNDNNNDNENGGNTSPDAPGSDFKMTAKVTELGEKIAVEVIESEYTFGIHWVITTASKYYDAEGNEISRSDIKVGDTVEILYSGQVMMSYPPQIVAARITVIE